MVAWLGYAALMTGIAAIDIRTRRIPSRWLLGLAGLALLDAAALPATPPGLPASLLGGGVGVGAFYLVYRGGILFARRMPTAQDSRPAFGFGDVKLMGAIGLMIGFPALLPAMLLAIVCGGVWATVILVRRRREVSSADETVPYAPCIVAGAMLAVLIGEGWLILWLGG